MLLGTTRNTHGTWFGQELFKLGLRLQRQVTVPDGPAVGEAMRAAMEDADVLLVTGGLGPTSDDLTREALAELLGLQMEEDVETLETLRGFFAKRGWEMPESNRKQAMVPRGAEILPNPNGTAPGLYLPAGLSGGMHCAVFLLPGPPVELYPMVHGEVAPRLKALAGVGAETSLVELRFVGVGESTVQEQIDEPLSAVEGLEVGYCARLGEVDVRLVGSDAALAAGREIAVAAFPTRLVSDDGASLEEAVVRLLRGQGKTLALAESCTGGLIANRVTDVPGASEVFEYGVVTYANKAKEELLGVSGQDLATHGAVSEPVARQMADGALRVSDADVAVAVTGIAGPGGGSEEKPVGTVFLAVAVRGGQTRVVRQFHPRSRVLFKRAVSQAALDLVRRVLTKASVCEG